MEVQDAIQEAQSVGGLLIPKTETHFVEMMAPTAKRHIEVDGKTAYQGHKWADMLTRLPTDRRDTYVDIGAHCALWSWFLSKRFRQTIAFEAAPLHAALFRANIYDGKWVEYQDKKGFPYYCAYGEDHGSITLNECAVGEYRDTVSIECAADETGSAHVAQGAGGDKRNGHGDLITYPDIVMEALDNFHFTRVDFVKIDVEGFELPVVKGGENFFRFHKPWVIIEQKSNDTIYGDPAHAASDLLKAWGWKDERVISGDHCMSPPS